MNKFAISLALVSLAGACGVEDTSAEYNYFQNGADWGTAVTGASLCDTGVEQSPINLTRATRNDNLSAVMTNYENYEHRDVELKTHTIEMPVMEGDLALTFANGESADFTPLQLHFHSPSEHSVDGVLFDLEMHIVHQYADGGLGGVIGIFFDRNAGGNSPNAYIESLDFENASAEGNEVNDVLLKDFLATADMKNFWSYDGSLTTPPCTEGIKWSVMREVQPISDAQLAGF